MTIRLFNNILLVVLLLSPLSVYSAAPDCDLHAVVNIDTDNAPVGLTSEVAELLQRRLITALNGAGMSASTDYGQLAVTAHFAELSTDAVAGPPAMTALHTILTLSMTDMAGNKVFDSKSFELRGVGVSEQKAAVNALSSLTKNNRGLQDFVEKSSQRTIDYFDRHYTDFLAQAKRAASMRDYGRALYLTTLIPQCCRGYRQAEDATLQYYRDYINHQGTMLLNKAKAAFAVSPNADGAIEAYALLNQIDPGSSAYPEAMKFAEEVRRQTKAEYDFEVHKKYDDRVAMQKSLIDAARQVGVAYGRGQKSTTTNILWK